jgi:hypothetical protein
MCASQAARPAPGEAAVLVRPLQCLAVEVWCEHLQNVAQQGQGGAPGARDAVQVVAGAGGAPAAAAAAMVVVVRWWSGCMRWGQAVQVVLCLRSGCLESLREYLDGVQSVPCISEGAAVNGRVLCGAGSSAGT